MKKCQKYKFKYEVKVDKIKSNIKILQTKRAKLQQQIESLDKSNKPKQEPKVDAKQASKSAPIKLPFPVLNDTRDMKTILGTLETKQVELINKIKLNRSTQNEKLKQQLYESQLEKINIQLDYVRLALNLESLREHNMSQPMMMMNSQQQILIDQMSARLNEMYNKMKMENKLYLKSHQQQQQHVNESKQQGELEAVSSKSQVSPPKTVTKPVDKLNQQLDVVNNSLAAVIAHTGKLN